MSSNFLIPVVSKQIPPGFYRSHHNLTKEELEQICQQNRWQGFYIEGTQITNKLELLRAWDDSLYFPRYFGENWDAFEDCLTDLGWCDRSPRIIIYDSPETLADAAPDVWKTVQEILTAVVNYWQSRTTPLTLVFVTTDPRFHFLPSLTPDLP